MEKENQIFGIRAIIEAINAKKEIDKVISIVKDAYDFYQIKYPKKKSKPKIIFLPSTSSFNARTP